MMTPPRDLRAVFEQYLGLPGSIVYRTVTAGKVETTAVELHTPMLVEIRAIVGNHVKQSSMAALLLQIAKAKEDEWHLAAMAPSWADTTAKQIRI